MILLFSILIIVMPPSSLITKHIRALIEINREVHLAGLAFTPYTQVICRRTQKLASVHRAGGPIEFRPYNLCTRRTRKGWP